MTFHGCWRTKFDFKGETLERAIRQTFTHRGTVWTTTPLAFTDDFAKNPDKNTQWKAFIKNSNLTLGPKNLTDAIATLKAFLLPVVGGRDHSPKVDSPRTLDKNLE